MMLKGMRKLMEYVKSNYSDCALIVKDEDGYPFSTRVNFTVDPEEGIIKIKKPVYLPISITDKEVNVIFNSIDPLPQGGYTNRRYVSFWGKVRDEAGYFSFKPIKSFRWDEKEVPFPQYVEMKTSVGKSYLSRIGVKPWMPRVWYALRVGRVPFLIATVLPVILGALVAGRYVQLDVWLLALTLIGASSIHLALNIANDYFDHVLGADVKNISPTPFSGGSRMIQYGFIQPSLAIKISYVLYGLGAGIGIYLALLRGLIPILAIGIAGLLISYFYTAPPVKLAYRGVGEVAVGTGFGPIMVLGSYFVQAQSFTLEAILISIPVGMMVMLILYVNEVPDRKYDSMAGKLTMVARLSKDGVLLGYAYSVIIIYGFIALSALLKITPLISLISLATFTMPVKVYRIMKGSFENTYGLIPAMSLNIKFYFYTTLLLIVAYTLNIIFQIP